MYGIDISQHQGSAFDISCYQHDFVIIRAGFGLSQDPLFNSFADQCERKGIPYGIYWYSYATAPDGGRSEADKCLQVIAGRKIQAGVWIDMEDADNYKQKACALTPYVCTGVCQKFCDRIAAAGYHAGIYASLSWFGPYGFITNTYGYDKWFAAWSYQPGDLSGQCSILQYRGAPLDLDVMYTPISWFGGEDPQPIRKTLDELAQEVIAGTWGNGPERKRALQQAGYDYDTVQQRVNDILSQNAPQSATELFLLAMAVIRGEYGNGIQRRLKLGSKYDAVQKEVNRILNSK